MSICETMQTQKWYYLCNMRSAYFPINRRLHWKSKWERAREGEREWADRLSGHFIWNMSSYIISVCTSSWSLHLTILGRVDLAAYLSTSSENLNSHLILVTSSDKFWGGSSDLVEHFICKLNLPKWASTTILHITPGKYEPSWLKFQ